MSLLGKACPRSAELNRELNGAEVAGECWVRLVKDM